MTRAPGLAALTAGAAAITLAGPAAADCADQSCPKEVSTAMSSSGGKLPLVLSVGVRSLSYVPSSHDRFDGSVQSSSLGYDFTGDQLGSSPLRAYGAEIGADYGLTPLVYVGAAAAWGEGSWSAQPFDAGSTTVSPRATVNSHMWLTGLRAGVRLPLGPVSLRAEVLGGAQWIDLQQFATSGGMQMTADASTVAWLVEPRVAADLWVTPYTVLSVFASMPDGSSSAADAGLMVAWHWRSFDGRYSGVL